METRDLIGHLINIQRDLNDLYENTSTNMVRENPFVYHLAYKAMAERVKELMDLIRAEASGV